MNTVKRLLVVVVIAGCCAAGWSCAGVAQRISEDDPCTRAHVTRQKASECRDPAEKDLLLQDAAVYDQQCRDRNANMPGVKPPR